MKNKTLDKNILDVVRKMFIKGICLTYSLKDKSCAITLANKAWEATYREKAIHLLTQDKDN